MCSEDPTESNKQAANWETIFYDNFNRSDTENGDIGPNWHVYNFTDSTVMKITDNQVRCELLRTPYFIQYNLMTSYALYNKEINYADVKITAKISTGNIDYATVFILCAMTNKNLDEGYFIGYGSTESFFEEIVNCYCNSIPYQLPDSTTYLFELVLNDINFEYSIKYMETNSVIVSGGGATGCSVPESRLVGFIAGAPFPKAVIIDDFKIEVITE
jgi:hypothetical protein